MSSFLRLSSWLPGQSSANSNTGSGSSEIDEGVPVGPKLLHGTLCINVCKLERPDSTTTNLKEKAGLTVGLGIVKFETTVEWGVPFHFHCAYIVSNISISLKYCGTSSGTKDVPVENILNGQETKTLVEIDGLEIVVKLQYFDVKEEHNRDVRSGVPNTYFQQREGCKVSLYQDAHVPDNFNPNSQPYQPKSCWEDVFDAINGAEHIIYITGWSVNTKISLIRDSRRPGRDRRTTLGELLNRKAEGGVQVLMLVWRNATGFVNTHDKETWEYFEGNNSKKKGVHCVLCSRKPDYREGYLQKAEVPIMWSHHQKTVVVDNIVPSGENKRCRQIVSFVGGIDLCDGRYDDPSHSLFRTLAKKEVHHDDFHQPSFPGSEIRKGGPREPWHDIHARLEGPIAWDVLDNFVERWKKQGKNEVELIDLEAKGIDRKFQFTGDETWCVQLFRSIDSGAADFRFRNTPEAAARAGLVSGKNKIIEQSIQDAYISAIRRAKNFIYIESQYFLGSSFAWNPDGTKLKNNTAWHLIPKELSLKIVRKIKAGKRFTVYVVVPMWPEGIPDSDPVQGILLEQRKTMEMMYKDVIQALKDKQSGEDPQNYLAFFCLGNREMKENGESPPTGQDSHYMRAQKARRFMIYVHSKMMIVDDEYIIIGSANINQRSMDGARDTEIAFGGYQPHHLATKDAAAKGQIYGFRKSLWYEHLRTSEHCFDRPEDEVCIKKVNELAKENWDAYSSGSGSPERNLPGHLLPYPVHIGTDGAITELRRFKFFPDTNASVLGKQSSFSSLPLIGPRIERIL